MIEGTSYSADYQGDISQQLFSFSFGIEAVNVGATGGRTRGGGGVGREEGWHLLCGCVEVHSHGVDM